MIIYEGFYAVSWCPNCDQGWILIQKELISQVLYVSCDECLVEWDNPEDIKKEDCGHFGKYNESERPTFEEIVAKGWDKFILKK